MKTLIMFQIYTIYLYYLISIYIYLYNDHKLIVM